MIRLLVVGFGLSLGWSAVRNAPELPRADHAVAVVLVLAALVGAYWSGRRAARGAVSATATATATATAAAAAQGGSAAVQVVVVNGQQGARAAGARQWGGLDSAEWIDRGNPDALDAGQLDELLAQEDVAQEIGETA